MNSLCYGIGARDEQSNLDPIADFLDDYFKFSDENKVINLPSQNNNITLYSSSMNFTIENNKTTSKNYQIGKYIALPKRKINQQHTWKVRDLLIKHIDSAKKSILLSLNHFNIREVSDALIRAIKGAKY